MHVTVRHYGAFRQLGSETQIELAAPASVAALRQALVAALGPDYRLLVEDSALASETEILPDDYVISSGCVLSVLPPVCGG